MRLLCITDNFRFGGLETRIADYIRHWNDWSIFAQAVHSDFPGIETVRLHAPAQEAFLTTVDDLVRRIEARAPDHVEIHPFTGFFSGFAAACLARRPVTLHFHGPASVAFGGADWQVRLFSDLLTTFRPCIAVVSEEIAALFSDRFGAGHDIRTVANGVERPATVDPPPEHTKSVGRSIALASRLDPDKMPGIVDLLDLTQLDGALTLDVYGDGPGAAALTAAVAERGLTDRVRLHGYVRTPAALHRPGQMVAGCGRALLEGLVSGRRGLVVSAQQVVAPIDRESVSRFAWANFSGRGVTPWPKDRILAALARPATAQDDLRDRISTTMRAEMVTLIRDRVARHVAWSTDDARAILDRHCRPGAPPEAPQTGPLPP